MEASSPPAPPPLCESAVNAFHAAAFALVTSLHAELASFRAFREATMRRLDTLESEVAIFRSHFSKDKTPLHRNSRHPEMMEYVTPVPVQSFRTPQAKRSQYAPPDMADATTCVVGAQSSAMEDTISTEKTRKTSSGSGNSARAKQAATTPGSKDSKLRRPPRHSRRPITPGPNSTPPPNAVANLFPVERRQEVKQGSVLEPGKDSNYSSYEAEERGKKRRRLPDTTGCLATGGEPYDQFDKYDNIDAGSDESGNNFKVYGKKASDSVSIERGDGSKEKPHTQSHMAQRSSRGKKEPIVKRSRQKESLNALKDYTFGVKNAVSVPRPDEADGPSVRQQAPEGKSAFAGFRTAGEAVRAAEDIQAAQRCHEIGLPVQDVVRGKERAALPAHDCPECDPFFRAEAESKPDPEEAYRYLLQNAGRHRCRHKAPATPEGYWDHSFNDTATQPP